MKSFTQFIESKINQLKYRGHHAPFVAYIAGDEAQESPQDFNAYINYIRKKAQHSFEPYIFPLLRRIKNDLQAMEGNPDHPHAVALKNLQSVAGDLVTAYGAAYDMWDKADVHNRRYSKDMENLAKRAKKTLDTVREVPVQYSTVPQALSRIIKFILVVATTIQKMYDPNATVYDPTVT
jgi:hypothetical protein